MHPRVLGTDAWQVVGSLRKAGILTDWTLAGGTGLALQIGHRVSVDLDFFRARSFEPDALVDRLRDLGSLRILGRARDTLHVAFEEVRLSFLGLRDPLLFSGTEYRGLTLADPRDIAVMKLVAIGGRGSRKDFVDLFFYLEAGAELGDVFDLARRRFSGIEYDEYHLLKSLVYFEDAETEPMPRMLREADWADVKRSLIAAVRRLAP
jgi:hypothetical protein